MNLKRVLLVEDDSEDHFLFTHALDCIACKVYCKSVYNGQEALDHLTHIHDYEIIFLDLNMPGMNGLDCLRLLKQHEKYKHIPVIIFTTSLYQPELYQCLELGARRIFHKPHSFPELCNELHTILLN